jgi:heme exporter protein A
VAGDWDHRGNVGAHLAVRGLVCRRGERTLISGLAFGAWAGEIVWVRGANGQGKTTLLRTLAGLSSADAGEIVWSDDPGRPAFVYIAHANALKDDLTAAEALRFLLQAAGASVGRADVDAALDRFGLGSRRNAFVRTLSQGQRRRVALARLAARDEPATWLLDEPFDALDAAGSDALNALIVAHARRGGSVVLTSHVPLAITDPAPTVVQLEAPVEA